MVQWYLTCSLLWTARKESAKEKQLKEEEKILESVAEGRGKIIILSSSCEDMLNSKSD